jgi:hypothetical protein
MPQQKNRGCYCKFPVALRELEEEAQVNAL